MHHHRIFEALLLKKSLAYSRIVSIVPCASFFHALFLSTGDIERVKLDPGDHPLQSVLNIRIHLGKKGQLMGLTGGQIDGVGLRDHGMKIIGGKRGQTVIVFCLQLFNNVLGKLHPASRQGDHMDPESRQRIDQGMDGPPVLEIPADHHGQPFQTALFFLQGIEVTEGLSRMLMTPISCIDYRNIGILGHGLHRPVPVMTNDQDVGIAGDHPGRIRDALPFGRGRGFHVGATDDRSS